MGIRKEIYTTSNCPAPENSHAPLLPQKELKFPGSAAFCKTSKRKEMNEALLEFPEGCRGLRKKSILLGTYGYFWNYIIDNKLLILKSIFHLQATWRPLEVQSDWFVERVPICLEAMASCLLSFAEKRESNK